MKKSIAQMLAISALFLLAACGNNEEAADELIDYYNEEWIPIHAMKSTEMHDAQTKLLKIMEEQGEDYEEEAIALIKDEILPVADEVLDRLESIELEQREVKKVNDLQIEAEEFARNFLEKGIDYYKGDITDTEYLNDESKLKEKYDAALDYQDELIEKYDLKYDKEKGKVDGFYELKHRED